MDYLLSLGSNYPDGDSRLQRALLWLQCKFSNVQTSGIYTSKALNGSAPDYYNMIVRISSSLDVTNLTAQTKAYEIECGRSPESKLSGLIEMDVDVIAAGNTILRPEEYTRPYFTHGLALLKS